MGSLARLRRGHERRGSPLGGQTRSWLCGASSSPRYGFPPGTLPYGPITPSGLHDARLGREAPLSLSLCQLPVQVYGKVYGDVLGIAHTLCGTLLHVRDPMRLHVFEEQAFKVSSEDRWVEQVTPLRG